MLLNINVPEPWSGGVRFTRQSKKITRNQLSEGKDPKGRNYYWIFEQKIEKDIEPDTDYAAVFAGDASVTPLHLDPTDTESLTSLSHWAEKLARLRTKIGFCRRRFSEHSHSWLLRGRKHHLDVSLKRKNLPTAPAALSRTVFTKPLAIGWAGDEAARPTTWR